MTQQINAVLQLRSSISNPIGINLSQIAQSEILPICVVHANRNGTQNFYKGNWKPRQGIGVSENKARTEEIWVYSTKGKRKKMN
jgi:hypothetical protein